MHTSVYGTCALDNDIKYSVYICGDVRIYVRMWDMSDLFTRPKTFDIGNDRRLFRPFTIPSTNRKRSEGATISVEVVYGLHDTIWFVYVYGMISK